MMSPVFKMAVLCSLAGLCWTGCANRGAGRPGPARPAAPGKAADVPPQGASLEAAQDTRACEAGDTLGCYHLGIIYVDGKGVQADPARAAVLFKRACAGGVALACRNLGIMYTDGRGVTRDEALAAHFFTAACDASDAPACSNLGIMYAAGRGVPKDEQRAVELLVKGCSSGDAWACQKLQ